MGLYVGIDGCKMGWVAVSIGKNNKVEINILKNIELIWNKFKKAELILIDMPIGLVDKLFIDKVNGRPNDNEGRKILKKRSMCVFSAPCREAVYKKNYEDANDINIKTREKGLSKQAYGIIGKIRELDKFLVNLNRRERKKIREVHPEVIFAFLNNGSPVMMNKKTENGYKKRKALISEVFDGAAKIIDNWAKEFPKKDVGRDDIVDAFVAAITACGGIKGLRTLPEKPVYDSKGLPMEIVYRESYR